MPFPLISSTHTDIWVTFWNVTFKAFIDSLEAGSDSAGWPVPLSLNGRVKSSEDDTLTPIVTGSPSLAFILPEGMQIVVGGKYFLLDSDVIISELPTNVDRWIVPTATFDEETEVYIWSFVPHITRPTIGSGAIAKVTTDSSSITALNVSEEQTDVILTLPLLFQRMRTLSGTEEGEGSSEVTQAEFNSLNARLNDALARISALEDAAGGGTTQAPINSDLMETRIAVTMGATARSYPHEISSAPASVYIENVTGSGEITIDGNLPDVRAGGDWP